MARASTSGSGGAAAWAAPKHRILRAAVSLAVVGPVVVAMALPADADTKPLPPVTTSTVSADVLPTVQINGVVWSQLVVGKTVYATGSFTSARPAGSPAGTDETPRSNILAYNLTTGVLKAGFAPRLNSQGLALAASPDGKRLYVGGDFTSVNGVARKRLAALDATTGALITTFAPNLNYRVRSIAVTAAAVYLGGGFSVANGKPRNHLAAFNPTTGGVLPWAPDADQEVMAITVPPGTDKVIAAGRFVTLNGVQNLGMGALDGTTGATLPWAADAVIQNYGVDAAIYSLTSDAHHVYGTGYGYLKDNPDSDANLENTFAALVTTGDLVWVSGCKGDTYGNWPQNGVVYTVGHAHDCSAIGGLPQTQPWTYQHAQAYTTAAAADGRVNQGGPFDGRPAPQLLHWLPTIAVGTFTGQRQGAWSVSGNRDYIVLGGEFPSINGVAQQGLARFAVSSIAPNKQGPQSVSQMLPAVVAQDGGVRVAWRTAWDRDNRNLTYTLLRGATLKTATTVLTRSKDSAWFNRPYLFFRDPTATPGSTVTYRLRVRDGWGNVGTTKPVTYTVPKVPASAYRTAVLGDGATHLWQLNEAAGSAGYDWARGDDLVVDPAVATRGTGGALRNEPAATSTTFTQPAATDPANPVTPPVPATTLAMAPGPQKFAVEAWFKTRSTTGGKIIGYGDSSLQNSTTYDRQIYLTDTGRLVFGVGGNGTHTAISPVSYNNGAWHHVVGSLGTKGINLYVDGALVARDADAVGAQKLIGVWRVGGDTLNGWPSRPTSTRFVGSLQDVAVYPHPLTLAQVKAHYAASGRTAPAP